MDPTTQKKRTFYTILLVFCLVLSAAMIAGGTVMVWQPLNAHEPYFESGPLFSVQAAQTQPVADEEWALILVNNCNPIPEGYQTDLVQLPDGHRTDRRIAGALEEMLADARSAGILVKISESYRTTAQQQALMDEKISEYRQQGHPYKTAKKLAEKWVAVPGTSEHEIGLAVDLTTSNRQQQDASYLWRWLRENSYQYGFILRYTEEKSAVTGCIDEPWHYRYVGKHAAKEIFEQGLCLEEYVQQKSGGNHHNPSF